MKKNLAKLSIWVVFAALSIGCGGNEGYIKLNAGQLPPMANWDGVYYSDTYGRMELSDNGNGTIVGLYEGERFHGKIEGTADGDLLNFKWTQWNEDLNGKSRQTTGQGYFRYVIKEEGTAEKSRPTHYAEGEWGYLGANSGHVWNCVRFPNNTKKILTMDGKKAELDENGSPFNSGGGASESSDNTTMPEASGDDNAIDDSAADAGGGLF